MLVQVHWTNNRYDYVKDFLLDSLIDSGVVARFLRSSGWVTVGVDPIRSGIGNPNYSGVERRSLYSAAGEAEWTSVGFVDG